MNTMHTDLPVHYMLYLRANHNARILTGPFDDEQEAASYAHSLAGDITHYTVWKTPVNATVDGLMYVGDWAFDDIDKLKQEIQR